MVEVFRDQPGETAALIDPDKWPLARREHDAAVVQEERMLGSIACFRVVIEIRLPTIEDVVQRWNPGVQHLSVADPQ